MLAVLRRILGFEMTIAEWIGTAAMLAVPYLAVGVLWSLTHTALLSQSHGADKVLAFLGAIASWPVLLVTNICVT
ncbi:MAG: hypothetical protein WAM92_02380 [Mycobacterium sp.]